MADLSRLWVTSGPAFRATLAMFGQTPFTILVILIGVVVAIRRERRGEGGIVKHLTALLAGLSVPAIFGGVIFVYQLGVYSAADQEPQSSPSPVQTQTLITKLQGIALSGPGLAEVSFSTLQQRQVAREIQDAFELAGWSSHIVATPTESLPNDPTSGIYHEGIEVEGNPRRLVDSVVKLLTEAGYQRVTGTTNQDPPRSIRVFVGH